jgi:hypothetical protein
MIVDRGWKNSLAVSDGSLESFLDWYCSVAMSVIVLGFFLGALPFSGEEFREVF